MSCAFDGSLDHLHEYGVAYELQLKSFEEQRLLFSHGEIISSDREIQMFNLLSKYFIYYLTYI